MGGRSLMGGGRLQEVVTHRGSVRLYLVFTSTLSQAYCT